MDILPPYEVYIDESNTPVFQSKPGLNSPYVVCAIAIPVVEKERIEILLPRDEQGHPLKGKRQINPIFTKRGSRCHDKAIKKKEASHGKVGRTSGTLLHTMQNY